MARYTVAEALDELKSIEGSLMPRVEEYLSKGDFKRVAYLLMVLEGEVEKIECEARRLRLSGELDYGIYRTLVEGYSKIVSSILELSAEHGLEDAVRSFYLFLKVEAQRAEGVRP